MESTVTADATPDAYDAVTGQRVATGIISRSDLVPGSNIRGPAIIAETQTTTVSGSHHVCTMQSDGTLLITRERRNS